MSRRRTFILPSALVIVALLVAACGGNAAPSLTDPSEILTKAITAMQSAKSVHLEASVDMGRRSGRRSGSGDVRHPRSRRRGREEGLRWYRAAQSSIGTARPYLTRSMTTMVWKRRTFGLSKKKRRVKSS